MAAQPITTTGDVQIPTANAASPDAPQTQEEVPSFLEGFQDALFSGSDEPASKVPSVAKLLGKNEFAVPESFGGKSLKDIQREGGQVGRTDVLAEILGIDENQKLTSGQVLTFKTPAGVNPSGSAEFQFLNRAFSKEIPGQTEAPKQINRLAAFKFLQDTFDVEEMTEGLNFLKAEQRDLEAQLRIDRTAERGKPVPVSVIAGRISKQEQLARENLEFNHRQQSFLTDQINSANNTISLYMNFAGMDYNDARQRYNDEFQQNLQIAQFTHNVETDQRDFQAAQEQLKIQNAQASLNTYVNAITSGNLNVADMGTEQKLQLNKLETQAGLQPGFISSLKLAPSDRILSISSDKTQAWVVGDDGNMQIINTGLTRATGSGTGVATAEATAETFDNLISSGKDFPALVEAFANRMSLEQIYNTYSKSQAGQTFGDPKEDAQAISLTYKVAKGEMTREEAREALGIE